MVTSSSTPLQRPDWFRLHANLIRLAVTKPPSARSYTGRRTMAERKSASRADRLEGGRFLRAGNAGFFRHRLFGFSVKIHQERSPNGYTSDSPRRIHRLRTLRTAYEARIPLRRRRASRSGERPLFSLDILHIGWHQSVSAFRWKWGWMTLSY